MNWGLWLSSIFLSITMMLAFACKWKFPFQSSAVGSISVTLIAAVPYLWIYYLCKTNIAIALAFFAQIASALLLGFLLIMFRFWRDPERIPSGEDQVILSAADGKIIQIRQVDKNSTLMVTKDGRDYFLEEMIGSDITKQEVFVVSIDMNFLDVHVNRCPISGQVIYQKFIKGEFISLGREHASFVNERLTTFIENPYLSVIVVQIASRLVHCVEAFIKVGDTVKCGQRLGRIRFGSQVTHIFPKREDVTIEVKTGDHVMAGITILARYQKPDTVSALQES
jgi:phosphatidylserine decarboxylase